MTQPNERTMRIEQIRQLPEQVAALVGKLTPEQCTAVTIPGEWSVAQNVHHLVDSHMNSYIRCKLIVTEENPTLKPYDQDVWAALPDAKEADVRVSLGLLQSLHTRWATFFAALPEAAWARTGYHPENGTVTLDDQLRTYAAHGLGHLDQIQRTLAAGS